MCSGAVEMPVSPVDVVFFAEYTASNFRALYRRFSGSPKIYTKDFFQLADQAERVLADAMGFSGAPIAMEYVWPGGSIPGELRHSSDRLHLTWPTGGPPPWRVGNATDGVTSIEGDPSKITIADAEAEFKRIEGLGHSPWLVGVLLVGEPTRMHVRVFFESPPEGLDDRKVEDLPEQVQRALKSLKRAATGALKAAHPAPPARAPALVRQIEEALVHSPNVLLVGPPGTGKTVALEDLMAKYAASGTPLFFDTDSWAANAFTEGPSVVEHRSETLVFHPSYSYENFVAGLYPKSGITGGTELEAVPGPLLRLGHWVGRSPRKALLILDEFNRGPAAAIFGDTLGLLDKDKRSSSSKSGTYIQRPYPDFPMGVSEDYASYGDTPSKTIAQQITLPSGLSLVAAMNSTDRSVAPLDAALRRRFHVIRVMPDYEVLAARFGFASGSVDALDLPTTNTPADWNLHQVRKLAIEVLRAINERVRFCLGDDFLLGHALLWRLGDSNQETVLADFAGAVDGFVVSTLRTAFLDQDDALAAVLSIPDASTRQSSLADVRWLGYWQNPPVGLDKIASRRLVLHSLWTLPPEAQLASLLALTE